MFNSNTDFSMPVVPAYGGGGLGGGFGSDWIGLIVILALLGGFGNGGFGFGGGGGNGVQRGFDQQAVIGKLDGLTYGLSDSTYALNNGINSGFNGVQQTLCQGFNGVDRAIADCCCGTQREIADVKYQMATQACETRQAIADGTKGIIDFLVNDKLATLQAENQNLRLQASQANQNAVLMAAMDANKAEIIRRTGNDCPVPAYVVQPSTPVTFPYNNYGCGCGF